MIPPVVASERGTAQTSGVARRGWGCRSARWDANREQSTLGKVAIDGDGRVGEAKGSIAVA